MVSSGDSSSSSSSSSPVVCPLLSTLPPAVISLVLPHLELASLLALEQTCRLLRSVVSQSGEYARRCRRLGLLTTRAGANSQHCKHHLQLQLRRQPPASITDHRVSQNLCFTRSSQCSIPASNPSPFRLARQQTLFISDHRINQNLCNEE